MDGKIIIGTEVDDTGVDDGLRDILKKVDEEDLKIAIGEFLEDEGIVDELRDKWAELYDLVKEYKASASYPIQTEATQEAIEETKQKIVELRSELEEITGNKIHIKGFDEVPPKIEDISKGLTNIISKIGKWGLALIGIRSAYALISQSISTLSQTDDGIATKIEYIRWAIANTLKPVIEWILNAVFKLLSLFGGLVKAITGYNIFAKSSVKSFENMKKSSGATKRNVNAIKKALYGWDELTRVEESKGIASGGGLSQGIQDAIKDIPKIDQEVDTIAQKIKRWFFGGDTLEEGLKNVIPTIRTKIDEIKTTILTPFKNWIIKEFEPLKKELEPLYTYVKNNIIEPLKKEFEIIKEHFKPIVDWIKKNVLDKIKEKFKKFKDDFIKLFAPFINTIIDFINNTFGIFGVHLDHVGEDIDKTGEKIETELIDNLGETARKAGEISMSEYVINIGNQQIVDTNNSLDGILGGLKKLTSKKWNIATSITTSGKTLKNWYNDTLRSKLSDFGIKLPKLAKGGIINMPGRGVPVGSALGGERGQEGVIPLTDSQQMALLGEAIGRYITINANITNMMNGRIISRELQKIQQENSFANNR